MSLNTAAHQIGDYQIITPVFQGPLDLLLQLIEKAELDITTLALAQVTDQFISYLHQLDAYSVDEVSAFIVIASKLIQIKSETLLPHPPIRQAGEEDPGDALARQLIAYRRFRMVADMFSERETRNLRAYLRMAPPIKVEGNVDLSNITLTDLVEAANQIFSQANLKTNLEDIVPAPKITIREKIAILTSALRQHQQVSFWSLIGKSRSRLEIVVTFLAMLELVKRFLVRVRQEKTFGDIRIDAAEDWSENEEFEIEFGE